GPAAPSLPEQPQPLLEQFLELFPAPPLEQHVPVGALVLTLLLELGPRDPARLVVEEAEFAALRIEPLRRDLGLRIEHDGEAVAPLGEVLDTLPRRELDAVLALQARRADARAS